MNNDYNYLDTPNIIKHRAKQSFFQSLVWENVVLRVLIESVIAFVLFEAILNLIVSEPLRQELVVQMAVLCSVVILMMFFDQYFFCQSIQKWEQSFFSAISGEIKSATKFLDEISNKKFRPPQSLYELRYAELLYMQGEIEAADKLIELAIESGARHSDCDLVKKRGHLFSNENETIKDGPEYRVQHPLVHLEEAMISLFKNDNRKNASSEIEAVMKSPPMMHPSLANSYDLCHLLQLCIGLHTGKSDEVIFQLSGLLDYLKLQISSSPGLRPYLSFAYLERAKYYARRSSTRQLAKADSMIALAICRYPAHIKISQELSVS